MNIGLKNKNKVSKQEQQLGRPPLPLEVIFKLFRYHLLQAANAHVDFSPDLGLSLHPYHQLDQEFTHIPSFFNFFFFFLLQNKRCVRFNGRIVIF